MIYDVLHEASTESEICRSLTCYFEAVHFSCASQRPAQHSLQINGIRDARVCFGTLLAELDTASRTLDDQARLEIKEALEVFGIAIHQLALMDQACRQQAA